MLEFEVCYVMFHILSALAYLHKRGIIHRDIKPENILLDLDDTKQNIVSAKLIDFGLSQIIEPNQLLYDPCGTPAFVAPEIIKKEGYNQKADVWSLGVITFLLYASIFQFHRIRGKHPYNATTRFHLFEMIKNNEPEYDDAWKVVSPEALDFVKCLLQKNQEKRFSAEEGLKHKWIVSNTAVFSLYDNLGNNEGKVSLL